MFRLDSDSIPGFVLVVFIPHIGHPSSQREPIVFKPCWEIIELGMLSNMTVIVFVYILLENLESRVPCNALFLLAGFVKTVCIMGFVVW